MYFLLKMGIIHCYISLPEGKHGRIDTQTTRLTLWSLLSCQFIEAQQLKLEEQQSKQQHQNNQNNQQPHNRNHKNKLQTQIINHQEFQVPTMEGFLNLVRQFLARSTTFPKGETRVKSMGIPAKVLSKVEISVFLAFSTFRKFFSPKIGENTEKTDSSHELW